MADLETGHDLTHGPTDPDTDILSVNPTIVSPHDYRTSADFRMVNQLLKNPRYEIPERLRNKIIGSVETLIDSPQTEDRTKLDAIKTIIALDKINVDIVKAVLPKRMEQTPVRALSDEALLEEVEKIMHSLPKRITNG